MPDTWRVRFEIRYLSPVPPDEIAQGLRKNLAPHDVDVTVGPGICSIIVRLEAEDEEEAKSEGRRIVVPVVNRAAFGNPEFTRLEAERE